MDDYVLRYQVIDDVAVVTYHPTHPGTILTAEQGVYALVEQLGFRKIILNMAGIAYLMSSRLGQMITLKHKLDRVQGQLRLCAMDPSLREVFEITKLDTLIPIHGDVATACKSFA